MTDHDEAPELSDEDLAFLHRVFQAARDGEPTLLDIVDQGIPVNLTNDNGDTLLMLAAYNRQHQLVRDLLARGADPDRVNRRGQTALACAIFQQSEPIVRDLLEAGADPRAGSSTAWQIADFFGLPGIRALLDAVAGSPES